MKYLTARTFFLAVLIGMIAPRAHAGDAVSVQVSPQVCVEGGDVRITVRVEPDPGNRLLTIVADSLDFFRSTEIQLSGESAPSVHTLMLHSPPSGFYEVRVTVVRPGGVLRTPPVELRVLGR